MSRKKILRQLLKPFYTLYVKKYLPNQKTRITAPQIKLQSEVSDIMTARVDILALEENLSLTQVMQIIAKSGFSRIPVYRKELDQILGVLYVKDLFKYLPQNQDFQWQKIIRPPFFVPEMKKTSSLLKEFLQQKRHQAIVVDEFGSVVGLISLEDILEEIVGEINDEFDTSTKILFTRIDKNTYLFNGKISINDFCKAIQKDEAEFDSLRGEADTLAGMLIEMTDHLPQTHETIEYKDYLFTIKKADKRKIESIELIIKN